MTRTAIIANPRATVEAISPYMPGNYTVVPRARGGVIIRGEDRDGWTLDGYVIPRLASGLWFAQEHVTEPDEETEPEANMVSQYTVSLEYGGPEEGGWHYDRREFVKVVLTMPDADRAEAIARALNADAQEHQIEDYGYSYTSVLGGVKTAYYTEGTMGEHDNTDDRPRYE